MRFAKLHGLGNSYIFIDLVRQEAPDVKWPELARRISDPAFGVGSDGLILILPPTRSGLADLRMRMFNADGSESEMCGNGIRCLARYAADTGLICGDRLSVETAAGVLNLELFRRNGNVAAVRVDMGEPRLKRSDIPMACPSDDSPADGDDPAERRDDRAAERPVINEPLRVGAEVYHVTALSLGNPHCVVLVDDVDQAPVAALGPLIETHAAFPNRTNVEFVQVVDQENVRMRVWERGSGETYACGTGACAAVVATSLMNLTGRRVTVHLLGGRLEIEWAPNGHVLMLGPCEAVCTGELNDEWLQA